jgi:hypothetical protein
MNVTFERVTGERGQVDVLYDLLKARTHGISHQALPDFSEHAAFVGDHPYRAWFLVRDDHGYIGSVYVTEQNTIGINVDERKIGGCIAAILDRIKSEYEPLPSIKSVRAGGFSVNVPPGSSELQSALIRCGCRIAQVSFFV